MFLFLCGAGPGGFNPPSPLSGPTTKKNFCVSSPGDKNKNCNIFLYLSTLPSIFLSFLFIFSILFPFTLIFILLSENKIVGNSHFWSLGLPDLFDYLPRFSINIEIYFRYWSTGEDDKCIIKEEECFIIKEEVDMSMPEHVGENSPGDKWPHVSTARLIRDPQLWPETDFWEWFYLFIKLLYTKILHKN